MDDVAEALTLVQRFATECGAEDSAVLVTGGPEFVADIATRVR